MNFQKMVTMKLLMLHTIPEIEQLLYQSEARMATARTGEEWMSGNFFAESAGRAGALAVGVFNRFYPEANPWNY